MCPFDGLLFFLQSFAAPVRCKESKNLGKTNIASCCCACGVGAVATALPLMIDHIFKKMSETKKTEEPELVGSLLRPSNLSAVDFCSSPGIPG